MQYREYGRMEQNGGQHDTAISAATTLKDGIIVYFHSLKGACRLKNNAVPSVFQLFTPPQGYGMTEEARNRLEMPEQCSTPKRYIRKRTLFQEEILSPAANVFCDHNYAKPANQAPQTTPSPLRVNVSQSQYFSSAWL